MFSFLFPCFVSKRIRIVGDSTGTTERYQAKSSVEWIANDRVRRSIIRHFRQFLMTYVDEHGASVYSQRVRNLGESEYCHRYLP